MTFNFWKFLFGLHRKSDESPNEKKKQTYKIYIYIYTSVFSNLFVI